MKSLHTLAAGALLAAVVCAPAQAAGSVTLVRQPDAAANLVGTVVLIRAGLDREEPTQNGLAALVAQSVLDTPVGGTPLTAAVDALGGSIRYAVEPHDVRFYIEGLPANYPTMLRDVRMALADPNFDPATLAHARTQIAQRERERQSTAATVGMEMINRTLYSESDAGLPPLGLPETIAQFSQADAQAFYARAYRRGGAVISIAGDFASLPAASYATLLDVLPAGASAPVVLHQPKVEASSRELIAHRDIPVPWLIAQYGAPPVASKDFGPMFVLSSFMERTLGDIASPGTAEIASVPRNVGAVYRYADTPASMVIVVDGGQNDPTRSFATALTVVGVIGHAKLGGDLSQMKSYAQGRFLAGTQTLEDRAWLGAIFAENGVTGDYVQRTLSAIDATTSADLQRVAARYLTTPTIALVLPRTDSPGVGAP